MSAALRLAVRKRADARCEYCRLPDLAPHLMLFHLEYVRARHHGGLDLLSNLAWACARCNERKGANLSGIDPDTSKVVRLFNPRRDAWTRHFVWEGLRIRGITAKGRAPGFWNSTRKNESNCVKDYGSWVFSDHRVAGERGFSQRMRETLCQKIDERFKTKP